MIKYIYTIFLGILLAIFVGVGISVFYPQPEAPRYPTELNYEGKLETEAERVAQRAFDIKQQAWEEEMKPYNRNVSIATLIAAIVFVSVGVILADKIKVIADGIVLGGVFTLLYSLGRGFASSNSRYTFLVVTISLIVAVVLGWLRFVKPHETVKAKGKSA